MIAIRRGRDAKSLPWKVFRNVDTMTLAAAVVDLADTCRPKAILLMVAALAAAWSIGSGSWASLFMTCNLALGVIPPTPELIADLEGVEYGYVMAGRAMQGVESANSSPAEPETLALRPFSVTIPQGMVTMISHRIEEAG